MKTSKLIVAVLAGLYFLWCAFDPYEWRLIDGVNLVIHEAGHFVFRPFGEFITIAGGSLFQVIMPALFVIYFAYHRNLYSASMVIFWVGQSTLNVSVYAGDAVAMQLPLLGGPDSFHDWNYLLTSMDLLMATSKVALLIRAAGTLLILGGCIGSVWFARNGETASR
jgi:hypothetical protein